MLREVRWTRESFFTNILGWHARALSWGVMIFIARLFAKQNKTIAQCSSIQPAALRETSVDFVRYQVLGTGEYYFPCSADHEQDWQPYPIHPYPAICDGHTY